MNYLDIFLIFVFAFSAYKGYQKGLLVALFSLLAFFLGLFMAIKFTAPISVKFFSDSTYFEGIAIAIFISIFAILILVIHLLSKALKTILDFTPLGILDNILGAGLNIFKIAFVLSWVIDSLGIDFSKEYIDNSIILSYIISFAPKSFEAIGSFIPYFKDIFDMFDLFKNN
jgi:membrane protein required for colicin V production